MKKILLKPFEALDTAWNQLNDFQQARLRLTGLYLVILFIILNIFTGSLFFILQKEEVKHADKIKLEWQEKKIIFPHKNITIIELTQSDNKPNQENLLAIQHAFLGVIKQWILIIEVVLLVLAGVMSYFLSGRTLHPIEKKNKQQKQFLADVSHELKNPLSALKMTLDISKRQKTWKQGEINEILSDIDIEISRLIVITKDLLTLEKPDKLSNHKKQNISPILTSVIKKCLPIVKKKNIEIVENISDFLVKGSGEDLEKVVFNILHNAVKFSHSNSKIFISLTSTGKLKIKDTGIGISKKDISKIFDRFYKVDSARTFSHENGSGLGLSIVKKICNKNNWKITIKSQKEEGTTVAVNFV